MNWLLPRIVAALILMALGGGIGLVVPGHSVPLFGALIGFTLALSVIAVRDTLHGYRLIEWLRGSQEGQAPRDAGLWGELGYRIERSIRLRERAADTERERLTQFLSAIEASPNGVMLLDAGDQIEWCNSLAADHFGLDPQRDRRQRVTNLVRAPAFVGYLQAARFIDAIQMPDPRGQRSLSVFVRPYGDGQRLVLSQDITERERSDDMRRDLVANVSHEIRTPLTVLAGFIETMANLPLTEVERKRVLVLMAQQADRMGTLVSDPADARTTRRQSAPACGSLGANWRRCSRRWRSMRSCCPRGATRWPSRRRSTRRSPALSNELLSAITNLVTNAVRYTPEGGRIELGWRVLGDGSGEIAVTDTGPGIAREHLPRLAERFYRVDGSRSRDTGGTGAGAVDRQARRAATWRRTRHPERGRSGLDLQAGVPGGPGAHRRGNRAGPCSHRCAEERALP